MERFLLLFVGLMSLCSFAQDRDKTFSFGAGYAEFGGVNLGIANYSSITDNLGFYLHLRGIDSSSDFSYGIDYGSIADVVLVDEYQTVGGAFGGVLGIIYSVNKTGFSFGSGVGYASKSIETHTRYKYDFVYIEDEYRTIVSVENKDQFTFDFMIDFKFNSKKSSGLGVQVGYNTLHKTFGLLYYSF